MKHSYLKYYDKYSLLAPLRFLWDSALYREQRKKPALIKRMHDYIELSRDSDMLSFHARLHKILYEGSLHWKSYDYGEGYLYQSLRKLKLRGFRDTEGRVLAMDLGSRVSGKRVLEIGCNTGFLSVHIAASARSVVGFDLAPHLIEVAREVTSYLRITNVNFHVSSFEEFHSDERFDVVISFANHSTYDGNTHQSLEEYFNRCAFFLAPDGIFLFESHPPEHEGSGLAEVCRLIGDKFSIDSCEVLNYGSFLDRNRTFITARM